MSDERAKRAAEKMNDWYGGMLAMPIDDQKAIDNTAPIIASEYAPVIAERDRLKKQVEELRREIALLVLYAGKERTAQAYMVLGLEQGTLKQVCKKCGVDVLRKINKYCGDGCDKDNSHQWEIVPSDAALQEQPNA
jgi:hypothetical protein